MKDIKHTNGPFDRYVYHALQYPNRVTVSRLFGKPLHPHTLFRQQNHSIRT